MNSLSFSKLNLVNPEPIDWPSNSVYTNKYGKIRCWPRNYEYLREFTNSLIPFFHRYCTFLLIFGLLRISIGLSVFGFVANEYKQITICSLSNIRNIRSGIRWAKPKVILNYSTLPNYDEWHYDEWIMKNGIMMNCIMMNGIMMNGIMMNVAKVSVGILSFDIASQLCWV